MKLRILIALVALVLLACGGSDETTGKAPVQLPTLKIGHVGHDHHIALYIAALDPEETKRRCGAWLAEKKPNEVYDLVVEGDPIAELHLIKVGGGSNMPAAMQRGEIDVGLGGIPAVISFVDKGAAIRILAPLNVDGDMLLVRPGLAAEDWVSFVETVRSAEKPIRIGYKAPVAVAKLVLVGALEDAGVPWNDAGPVEGGVELVNLQGGKNIVPALESGAVDGAVINEPFGSLAVAKGVGKIVSLLADLPPEGRWRNHPCCCVCATEDAISGRRKAVRALLGVMVAATGYIHDDPEGAAKLAARWTKIDPAVEARSVPNITYLMEPGERYRQGLATWYAMMANLGQFGDRLKGVGFDQAFGLTHDLGLIEEVMENR